MLMKKTKNFNIDFFFQKRETDIGWLAIVHEICLEPHAWWFQTREKPLLRTTTRYVSVMTSALLTVKQSY